MTIFCKLHIIPLLKPYFTMALWCVEDTVHHFGGRENECLKSMSLESALKRFKRSCAKSGVLAEVRKREHYESPSVKRRKKSEAARKNRKKYY